MYAVVQLGSIQYKISQGDRIEVQRIAAPQDKKIHLDKVLFFAGDKDVRIGKPYLEDVKVTALMLDEVLDEKKVAFKFRRRKGSARKKGHRQKLTVLNITKIEAK